MAADRPPTHAGALQPAGGGPPAAGGPPAGGGPPGAPRAVVPVHSGGAPARPARPEHPPRPNARRGRWGPLSLRWRLTLAYAGMLAVLLTLLAVALNAIVGNVLYHDQLVTFQTEARTTVRAQMPRFDAMVRGTRTTVTGQTVTSCADALSYQQAFLDAIGTPLLDYHTDVQRVFLLDPSGAVLAPDDGAVPLGQEPPEVGPARVAAITSQAQASGINTIGVLAEASYTTSGPRRVPMGVELFAIRYHTASACQDPRGRAVGIVEVATTYPTVRAILGRLRIVLLLGVLAVFAAGLLIGAPVTAGALRPLARMTQTARRIASGDLSQRVDLPHADDEIGQLARTFDEMVARIEAAFGAQAASEGQMRQFVADASHELRTPLTSIRGYLDVLLRGAAADDPVEARRVLLAARSEAERMTGLVGDLLTLARLDAGPTLHRQPVDLWALVGGAVDQARILAGEREVSLASDQGGAPRVLGDPDRLKQVLLILLDNALKYGRPAPEGWVRVRVGRTEHGGVVSVMDNGQGIAPEDLEHIFDRFYRGERAARQRRMSGVHGGAAGGGEAGVGSGSGGGGSPTWAGAGGSPSGGGTGSSPGRTPSGSGLGLAIAEAIVRAHGGTLSVESRVGVGTTFTMVLPAA